MKIKPRIKDFIISEFLPGAHSVDLRDDLNLIENGIMDSLGVLKLVAYMENEFDIALNPEEIDMDHLNSIDAITGIVENKRLQAVA